MIKSLDARNQSTGSGNDLQTLKNKLAEKQKYIEHLEVKINSLFDSSCFKNEALSFINSEILYVTNFITSRTDYHFLCTCSFHLAFSCEY